MASKASIGVWGKPPAELNVDATIPDAVIVRHLMSTVGAILARAVEMPGVPLDTMAAMVTDRDSLARLRRPRWR